MADTAAPAKGLGATLAKKVGPFPLGVWAAAGVGLLYYYERKQKAAGTNPAAAQSATGYGTDPAGNVGYIDPQSGYVYGSAEDIAALQNQGLVGANQYAGQAGSAGTSGVGSTADTSGSGGAASGGSTNPSGTAITTGGTISPPVTSTGAGIPASKKWSYPAPSGLAASSVSDSGFGLSWNPVQGPNGQKPSNYTVQCYQGNAKVDQFISGSTSTREYGSGGRGLKPATSYLVRVWANGGPVAPAGASITVTTKPKGSK